MKFTYKVWDEFCHNLDLQGINSIPAKDINNSAKYIVLKHDVETNVMHAYKIACIESRNNHRGSYYVQAYLLNNQKNVMLLKKIQEMGHEVSYHYDVMDSNKGNIDNAIIEFDKNIALFKQNGFCIKTVCQHGNPVIERIGYSSNRDFFRSSFVQNRYPEICDVMVNFKSMYGTEYNYYSDAGRRFNLIADPINNDIVPSDDLNIAFDNLSCLFDNIRQSASNNIISIHPHRWSKSSIGFSVKNYFFKLIRIVAKQLIKITLIKRVMSRYYYLAKKI